MRDRLRYSLYKRRQSGREEKRDDKTHIVEKPSETILIKDSIEREAHPLHVGYFQTVSLSFGG